MTDRDPRLWLLTPRQVHYARANALASYKAKDLKDIAAVSCLAVSSLVQVQLLTCPGCEYSRAYHKRDESPYHILQGVWCLASRNRKNPGTPRSVPSYFSIPLAMFVQCG